MAESLHSLAQKFTKSTTTAVHGFHGAGDAIRGTINSSIDGLVPNHESKEGGGRARNEEIAQHGMGEMRGAEEYFHGRGDGSALPSGQDGGSGTAVNRYGGTTGGPVQYGDGGHADAASAGAGGGWNGASLDDFQRQERERERMWEQERREREQEFQRHQHQQQQNQYPPPPPPPAVQQQPPAVPPREVSPVLAANTSPTSAQPQGQGFKNGHTMRENGGSHTHSGLAQKLGYHKSTAAGQGKWLSQGGVRNTVDQTPEGQISSQAEQQQQQQDHNVGAGAARLAWTGGQR